jgi:hypothetical protein
MAPTPSRASWAIALATLVGGIGGTFLAGSGPALGITIEGRYPLLGGSAAIYAGFALAAVLCPAAAAVVA